MKKKQEKVKTIAIHQTNESDVITYEAELSLLTKEMIKEYYKAILLYYRQYRTYIVNDINVVGGLEDIINRIGKKWHGIFIKKSDRLAQNVVYTAKDFSNRQFKRIKENNPFLLSDTKDFQQTTKIIEASIIENIGLIKSIPEEYHNKILGSVMRSVGSGGNLKELSENLSKISNQTKKRINLIARDQVAKATALINQQNAVDAGFTTAVWKKSIAGKTHRLSHAQADGKEFDITKGCLIDDEYILPREKINCKCSYKLIVKIT
jgi:uncharacterized protein with gpF-like domain